MKQRNLSAVALAALFSSSAFAGPEFDTWAEQLAAQRMRAHPVSATLQQYFLGEEQAKLDGRFAPITKEARLAQIADECRALAELHAMDPKTLTPEQKVSTGVTGWSLEQAVDCGIPAGPVDRYVVWPGQACAYGLGRLKIEALRDKTKIALGERFDIKKFHNLVLLTRNVPLNVPLNALLKVPLKVLEDVVDDWIAQSKPAQKA